ncbi:MAG TPA: type II toxin-antitoxin system RelE/ParE family toxin [Longimicrobiaceae bacterium]|nr:type II toxin-antitoxin system RelE/ParE family toxin [Longimicrobiaceae bacterium]
MTRRRVELRATAQRDIDEAIAHYMREGALEAASRFVDELQHAFETLARHPEAGSPRYAHELNLPGLRFWVVRGFPHLVFYVERPDYVDVWRVLHGERDLPAWMRVP